MIAFHIYLSPRNNSSLELYSFDSSFDHLESISLIGIHPHALRSSLIRLSAVPRLYSLTIDTWNDFNDLQWIYRSIFALPTLKFYKFTISESRNRIYQISLPMANRNERSTMKYLHMVHSCSINELEHIVSYTPELRHLKFINNSEDYLDSGSFQYQ